MNLSNIFIGFLAHEHTHGYISKPSPFEGIDMVMYVIESEYQDTIIRYLSKNDPIHTDRVPRP